MGDPTPAFVFPGQGSQYPRMGRDLRAWGGEAIEVVETAEQTTNIPLTELMDRADAVTLADPEISQLTVYVSSIAMLHGLTRAGLSPASVAGHSLGEYTALVAAGCLDWQEALAVVARRGRAMSEAARRHPGAMAAIVGLPVPTVRELCHGISTAACPLFVANVNSPRQVVLSGAPEAVDEAIEVARGHGAIRARRLPVGGAYHTPFMAEAQQELEPVLATMPLREPRLPIASSMTGRQVTNFPHYCTQLRRQMTQTVRWHAAMTTLVDLGADTFVEVGPGRVLHGLGREVARGLKHLSARDALTQRVEPAGEPVGVAGSRR